MFLFEKLDVYQKSMVFSKSVIETTAKFARGNYAVADQFRRAALSIPLNIAEGNGRWHARDRKSFFLIARGSAFECVPLIEICKDFGYIDEQTYSSLRSTIEEIGRMLNGLITATEAKKFESRD